MITVYLCVAAAAKPALSEAEGAAKRRRRRILRIDRV
jgi:hypothetical protein